MEYWFHGTSTTDIEALAAMLRGVDDLATVRQLTDSLRAKRVTLEQVLLQQTVQRQQERSDHAE